MKKFLIICFVIFVFVIQVLAVEPNIGVLSKLENSVFGTDYPNLKIEDRLSKLEETIYGHRRSGKSSERMQKLAKDMNAEMIGQEVTPETGMGEMISQELEENIPDNSVEYPILTDVEKHLAIKDTSKQSLHNRLVTIEKKLFNNVYDTDDYYTRVERIKGKVYGTPDLVAQGLGPRDVLIPEYSSQGQDVWGMDEISGEIEDDYVNIPNNFFKRSSGSISNKISELERKLFKNTYPDEENNDRLARLESSVFDTEFYYDNENERINRLEGALKGQKSANKYDSNKFQQGLNTALQIGAMVLMVLAFIL